MKTAKLEIVFPSDLQIIKPIIKDILLFIRNNVKKCDSDTLFDLKLIYNELLVNSILHGNQQNSRKNVKVLIITNYEDLIFSSVIDEGNGFNYKQLLHQSNHTKNLFSENGRGMQLVYSLSDRLRFNRKGNKIVFFKRVNGNGQNISCR